MSRGVAQAFAETGRVVECGRAARLMWWTLGPWGVTKVFAGRCILARWTMAKGNLDGWVRWMMA